MKVASDVLINAHIRQALQEASERVREGASLWTALDKTQLFSPDDAAYHRQWGKIRRA